MDNSSISPAISVEDVMTTLRALDNYHSYLNEMKLSPATSTIQKKNLTQEIQRVMTARERIGQIVIQ